MVEKSQLRDQLFAHLCQLTDECLRDSEVLRLDKNHPQQLYSTLCYGTILELALGIRTLIQAGQTMCVPILLRSILEAFASFRALLSDPNYFKSMYASFLSEKVRLLESAAANPESPYLKPLVTSVNVPEEKVNLSKEIADLAKQGYGPVSIKRQFAKAGLEGEYDSIYWQLCLETHNNVSALEDRHIEQVGEDFRTTFFKGEDVRDAMRYMDSLCGILTQASLELHSKLQTGAEAHYQAQFERLNALRKEYQ
jgi:hypothetical protein